MTFQRVFELVGHLAALCTVVDFAIRWRKAARGGRRAFGTGQLVIYSTILSVSLAIAFLLPVLSGLPTQAPTIAPPGISETDGSSPRRGSTGIRVGVLPGANETKHQHKIKISVTKPDALVSDFTTDDAGWFALSKTIDWLVGRKPNEISFANQTELESAIAQLALEKVSGQEETEILLSRALRVDYFVRPRIQDISIEPNNSKSPPISTVTVKVVLRLELVRAGDTNVLSSCEIRGRKFHSASQGGANFHVDEINLIKQAIEDCFCPTNVDTGKLSVADQQRCMLNRDRLNQLVTDISQVGAKP